MIATGMVLVAAACAPPGPSPTPTASPTPAPSLAAIIPVVVRFEGRVDCNHGIMYACAPRLSVVEPGWEMPSSWRPGASDPIFVRLGNDSNATSFDPTPVPGPALVAPGPHRLVMSLVGASDMQSTNPDGTTDSLLSWCSADVDVAADARAIDLVVTFAQGGAACSAEVE